MLDKSYIRAFIAEIAEVSRRYGLSICPEEEGSLSIEMNPDLVENNIKHGIEQASLQRTET